MNARVDLSSLPPPEVVEVLDFDAVLAAILDDMRVRAPHLAPALEFESEPVVILAQAMAWREVTLRARINDAARGTMLAYASGGSLDQLAALLGIVRLVVDPGDPSAQPPVPPTMESDARLRARTQEALEGFSTCGPARAYAHHARSVDGRIADVAVGSPAPGTVQVVIAAFEADGSHTDAPRDAVLTALRDDDVRPLTDLVLVESAAPVAVDVTATLRIADGPDVQLVVDAARTRLEAAMRAVRLIGRDVPLSAIYAALHGGGIAGVELVEPAEDVVIGDLEVPVLGEVTLTRTAVIP